MTSVLKRAEIQTSRDERVEKLFVYGTLKQSEIQKEVFGRIAELREDILWGYKIGKVEIEGVFYPIAIPEVDSTIVGKILEVTTEELEMIDKYETATYQRAKVTLESGLSSWVYCQPLCTTGSLSIRQ